MMSTFWDIPGIRSNESLEFLERSLNPLCVYDDRGQTIYASQSCLELLRANAKEVDFFDYFPSGSTTLTILKKFWDRALRGEIIEFLAKTRDAWEDIECSLQFNPDAKLMFLTAKKTGADADTGKLMEEYERAIALFNHPSLATALLSPDGSVVKCNQRLHELLGTSDREAVCMEKFVHPEDRFVDADLKQQLMDGDIKSFTIEKRFVSRKHEILWINASVSLIEMPASVNGHRKYFAAVLEDITESQKIYNALVRTEEKWKSFVLNSPYLFIQISNVGQVIYASPAVEHLLGYTKEELLGRQITEFIHVNNVNEFELALQLWVSNMQSSKPGIECWWRAKSGRWVSCYIQGQRFPGVLEMDGIVISGYNITERKCLEAELQASEEKFRSLVLNIPGAVFRCDLTYTMKFVSDGIEGITGYPAAMFNHNQIRSYLSIIHPDDIGLIKDSLVQSILDHYRCSVDYRIIHANGQVRWVSERKQGVFDRDGNLLWLDGVLLDVTDSKQAEEKLHHYEAINHAMIQMLPNLMRSEISSNQNTCRGRFCN